jgi:hypothetical protein
VSAYEGLEEISPPSPPLGVAKRSEGVEVARRPLARAFNDVAGRHDGCRTLVREESVERFRLVSAYPVQS